MQSPIEVPSLVLLFDQEEKREGKKDTWCQHIVQPLRPNLRNCLFFEILFFIGTPTHIWDLEYEEESNGKHVEPESQPGAWKSKVNQSYERISSSCGYP